MKEEKNIPHSKDGAISRRKFVGNAVAAAATISIVPRHVIGQGQTPPSEKVNIAGIGIGGMGKNNIAAVESQNIVALCDVDWNYAADVFKKYPNARKWKDFRKMLEEQKDIDAVIIATPDHAHAVIAMEAMRHGKHVYVQKPLARTVYETRMLTEAARKYKVASQMGNQGHSGDGVRDITEWINAGVIGEVREVHCWTNRPIWPQGIGRPKGSDPVPADFDWDLWIGPSPYRPFVGPKDGQSRGPYHPFNWRGWWDFGCGALGDMACHVMDPVFTALKLGYPTAVVACATDHGEEANKETFPLASIIRYEFPARGDMPPVKVSWYDGGMMPPRPADLEPNRRLNQAPSNVLFLGSKGTLRCGEYGDRPQLLPYSRNREFMNNRPPQTIPRIKTSHEMNWVEACKGGAPATSNFDYSGPLAESVVMGNLAIRRLNQRLEWDGENMKFTNDDEANQYVKPDFRDGWSLGV